MAVFEDVFSDAQSEMVSVAVEYSGGQASDIFIYFSRQGGIHTAQVRYVQQGKVVNSKDLAGVDTSPSRQMAVLRHMVAQVSRIEAAGKEFGRDAPTEGYLHYRVTTGSLDARYSNSDIPPGEDPHWDDKVAAWMAAVQKELDAGRSA